MLRVVEVYGAALLAEEMEQTSRWLAGNDTDARQFVDGLDALMRSSVQLPTYLERVLGGGRDLALVLLPLLNDLRAVRGAPLLSEGTLLSLNLSSEKAPAVPAIAAATEQKLTVPQWARRLRPKFQAGLLGLIRGDGQDRGLTALADVANRMEAIATSAPLYQLWWVTGALLDALRAGGLEASVTVKRLLGHADRELKRLYAQGEEAYSGSAADRAAEQPPFLCRARDHARRAYRRGPRLLPPRRAAADRRVRRAGARIAVGAVGAADAHGRGRDQGGPRPRQGRARPLHAQGRAAGGTRAAGRPAEEDRRHARGTGARFRARAGAGRARRGSPTSSRAACLPSRTR